ncbi:MAG: TIGR04372 family glycosyltransferase [Deltaproteobacteria bacterium]|nr:TIGR04372 family glycosyltransferase [Deltaproteobacteria bacterium]
MNPEKNQSGLVWSKRLLFWLGRRVIDLLLILRLARPLAVAALTVLRPFVRIRIGRLNSARLGHFALDAELYLCERDADKQDGNALDVFYLRSNRVCNQKLAEMFGRRIRIWPWLKHLNSSYKKLPQAHQVSIIAAKDYGSRDLECLLESCPAHLSFSEEEERAGEAALREMGHPQGAEFVCFFARDPAYLKALTGEDRSVQDFRDSDIEAYLPAALELARRGHTLLRLGAAVSKALPQTGQPRIIDYATSHRTEFIDIYLSARCRFFMGDSGGLTSLPAIFRRPILWTNFVPLEYLWGWASQDIVLPKMYWLREERRLLSFSEILRSGAGRLLQGCLFEERGIELISNTAEEIRAAAVEMDERLKGTWQTSEEDEELQRRFWDLFPASELNQVFLCRIGAEFLRQHRELLA